MVVVKCWASKTEGLDPNMGGRKMQRCGRAKRTTGVKARRRKSLKHVKSAINVCSSY
jgi:hypothetical protein